MQLDAPLAPPPANKTVNVTGNVTAATVALTYTNSPVISFGMFNEGRNPATGWTSTGADYGNVTITRDQMHLLRGPSTHSLTIAMATLQMARCTATSS